MLSKFGAVVPATPNKKWSIAPAEMPQPYCQKPTAPACAYIMHNEMMIIIRTSPGAAQLIARLLDSLGTADGVLGTIAGDDTIFIAPAKISEIDVTLDKVKTLFDNV